MARKTKKEKILAEYRRKLQSLESAPHHAPSTIRQLADQPLQTINLQPRAPNPLSHYSLPLSRPDSVTGSTSKIDNYSYVTTDLRRITFLALLAICAQLVLWYLLGLGNRTLG